MQRTQKTHDQDEPVLVFNPATGYLEVSCTIRVDPKIHKQVLLERLKQDDTLDLTDPAALLAAQAQVSLARRWLGHPAAQIVYTPAPQALPAPVIDSDPPQETPVPVVESPLRTQLREKIRHIAPSLWWEQGPLIETPGTGSTMDQKRKDVIYAERSRQRTIIEELRQDLHAGKWELAPEAIAAEEAIKAKQLKQQTAQLEAVAQAVNSNSHK